MHFPRPLARVNFCPNMCAGEGRGLKKLLALPALVELNAQAFCDDLDGDEDGMVEERCDQLRAALASIKAKFNTNGRSLTTEAGRL